MSPVMQNVLARTTHQHRVMVDGMAGGGKELHRFVKRKIALHDLGALGFDNGQTELVIQGTPAGSSFSFCVQ